jgi:hypothetical protein
LAVTTHNEASFEALKFAVVRELVFVYPLSREWKGPCRCLCYRLGVVFLMSLVFHTLSFELAILKRMMKCLLV